MHKLMIALLLLPFYTPDRALAACPKNKKEWLALGPKILVEAAAIKATEADIPDFSSQLGKSAQGLVTLFKEQKKSFVLVEAKLPKESLFLSGVMKCDLATKQPVLLSLTWMK